MIKALFDSFLKVSKISYLVQVQIVNRKILEKKV